MFAKTYRTTMRTIVRSPLTWGAVALLLAIGIYFQFQVHYTRFDPVTLKSFVDTDPGYGMSFETYIDVVLNTPLTVTLMLFTAPALCVIGSGVVLTRDWRDNFFEVDRAGGVSIRKYFLGRYLAVLTFVTAVSLIADLLFFHLFFLIRRRVESMSPGQFFIDSTVRQLRVFFTSVFPGLLAFVGVTFFACNLMRSGATGMITGLGYVIFSFATKTYLQFRLPAFVLNNLHPVPTNLYIYWAFYGTERFENMLINPFLKGGMPTCLLCLYAFSLIFTFASYFCVKKRQI